MALRDEIKEGRKDLMEHGSFKDKLAYFFDYYKVHTIVIVVLVISITSFIYHQVTKPEIVFNGLVLNTMSFEKGNPVQELSEGFLEYIDMDPKEYEVSLNSSLMINVPGASQLTDDYAASQAIMAQCAAGVVDFLSAPLESVLNYGYGDLIVDLRTVLTEEELAKYEPYLLYADEAVAEQRAKALDNGEDVDKIAFPDPKKPEEMKKPVPVFIDVTSCEIMKNIYSYSEDTLVIAISVNAPNPDRIPQFLTYLFES